MRRNIKADCQATSAQNRLEFSQDSQLKMQEVSCGEMNLFFYCKYKRSEVKLAVIFFTYSFPGDA
jgi:hypothetical protein